MLLAGALSSCEKDSYQKSPITETFFKVVDATHINTYDQLDILVEENKVVSYEIRTQDDKAAFDTIYVAEGESLKRGFMYGSYQRSEDASIEDDNILFTFQYNDSEGIFKNHIRIIGMLHKSQSSTPDKPDYLFCKSNVVLQATILPSEMKGNEKTAKVLYELKCDTLVLASATQKFIVFNN
ncbi:MAG: hypothetical protein IJ738_02710 [Alphaproteobacteria bacterium]|nr:hypothetical protein [Alphaproteobacteria bacterium]